MPKLILSRKNKVLLVPEAPDAANYFPDHPTLDGHIVVPHNLRSTLLCRALGYQTPNPMLCYYDWKGATPFAIQRATCDLITANRRAYVLNSMGTGKTKVACWGWDYLQQEGLCQRMLVVATRSTLYFTWASEIFRTLPHRKVNVLYGTRKERLELLRDPADIYVINHDGLKTIYDELCLRTDINVLCLDELAVYRNNSDRSKAMRKFAERFEWVWGMTGRPMPNEPTDVWAQAKIVTPWTVPKFQRIAEAMLMTKISTYKWVPKTDAVETAFKMLQPAVRYALDDVVELPPVIYRTVDVPLTKKQESVYKTLANEFQVQVDTKKITAVNAGVAMGKLLQVSGGWVYAGEKKVVALDNKPRVDMLIDLIEEAERKVLVFVPYRHAIAGLSAALTTAGLTDHACVDGQTTKRDDIFNTFQNTTNLRILLAHPACLAHGLTLTAADTIIWYMPITSLEIYEQANARIRRVGQKHKQQILHLQSTAVERKIYALLRNKQKIQDALLDMFAEATQKAA